MSVKDICVQKPGLALAAALSATALLPAQSAWAAASINKGDTAWMLVATSLVVFMTVPGLALFYGGLVRSQERSLGADAGLRRLQPAGHPLGRSMAIHWPSPTAMPSSAASTRPS